MKKLIPAIFLIAIILSACVTDIYTEAKDYYTIYGTADSCRIEYRNYGDYSENYDSVYYKEDYPHKFTIEYLVAGPHRQYLTITNISDTGIVYIGGGEDIYSGKYDSNYVYGLLPGEQYTKEF